MKLCVNCKYFSGSNFCISPSNGISPVTGKANVVFASTSRQSSSFTVRPVPEKDNDCGPGARFYVEKETIPRRWWHFFTRG